MSRVVERRCIDCAHFYQELPNEAFPNESPSGLCGAHPMYEEEILNGEPDKEAGCWQRRTKIRLWWNRVVKGYGPGMGV